MKQAITVVIQAGGASSRMGEDKALKLFLGRPLIQRVVEQLSSIADELIVTTNRPAEYAFLNVSTRPARQSARLIPDLKPGRGALGGLYTAIASATHSLVAVAACDMPFASQMFFEGARRLMVKEEADVVIAKTDEGYEPFHALYRRETCLPAIESAIEADQWKVIAWFPQVKIRTLNPVEVKSLDPSGLCFWNLNTPEEFAEAEERANAQ
ncbi:MAG: molybdenum cofactor guanylyltransferase [Chloroflexi bacterium]|nr:molybdenum cofactor guanylyltransferase [Chloroflexota bacterium]